MSDFITIPVDSCTLDMINLLGKLNSNSLSTTFEESNSSFVIDIRGLVKIDFASKQYTLYLKPLYEKYSIEKFLINIPSCCKDNPFACIEIKIDNSFSNKIMLCKKHYDSHVESCDSSVSIHGHVLKRKSRVDKNGETT